MTRVVRYPVLRGGEFEHGINIHHAAQISSTMWRLREAGIAPSLTRDHYGPGAIRVIAPDVAPQSYINQMEMVLPVRLVRPIWNLHSFDANGNFNATDDALWKAFRDRGWKILLCMFDGPSQRYFSMARGPEHVMACWRRRHTYGWRKMMDWCAANDMLGAIHGIEPLNEPNGYNQWENNQPAQLERILWHYTEHCKNIWDITREYTTEPEMIMGGWRWSESLVPFQTVFIPQYGMTATDHLAEYYPDKVVDQGIHKGAGSPAVMTTPRDFWSRYSPSDLGRMSDARFGDARINVTEILGLRNNAIHMVPVVEPEQHLWPKNLVDIWHYFSASHWWWPFSNTARAQLIRLGPNAPTDFYRHTITACTAIYCYPNRAEYFSGPQQGIKDETSPDARTILQSSNYDIADVERIWAADQELPANSRRLTLHFGGRGVCLLNLTPGQFNSAFGGDGWTVVHGTDTSWDIAYLGRGGGVTRLRAGLNIVSTRWGEARVYTGSGRNITFCYTANTPFGPINALNHETTVVIHPQGNHYIYDWHRANHKISFMGAFATPDDLRAAASFVPSSIPSMWSQDLVIALPGGGSVRMSHGTQCMQRLIANTRDFADGWYGPGWQEPEDYDPAALTAPIVDPGPAFDALYVPDGAQASGLFDWNGQEMQAFDWAGNPIQIALWGNQ